MAKKKQTETFEDSLHELQEIVSDLEAGALGLEESLKRFERGTELLRNCHSKLESAEATIQKLTGFDADGNPVTAPFDATDTLSQKEAKAGKRKSASKKQKKQDEDETEEDDSGMLF